MGCWNETCALSHLPILPDDEVVYLLLTQSPFSITPEPNANAFGTGGYWGVRTIPIFGTYEDYGNFSPNKDQLPIIHRVVEAKFKDDVVTRVATDREKLDQGLPVLPQNCNFKNINMWISDGGVQIYDEIGAGSNSQTVKLKIERILIRRDIWDTFRDMDNDRKKGKSYFKKLEEDLVSFQESVLKKYGEGIHFLEFVSSVLSQSSPNILLDCALGMGSFSACTANSTTILKNAFKDVNTADISKEDFRQVTQQFIELALVENTMAGNRMNWSPTSFTGSQENNFEARCRLFLKMAEVAHKVCLADDTFWYDDPAAADEHYAELQYAFSSTYSRVEAATTTCYYERLEGKRDADEEE